MYAARSRLNAAPPSRRSKYASCCSRLSSHEGLTRRGRAFLRALDAVAEALRRRAQRELGVDVHAPRDVDGREEHVAELVEDMRVGLGLRCGLAARPRSRPSARAARRRDPRARRRRRGTRSRSPRRAAAPCARAAATAALSGTSWKMPAAAFLLALDRLPVRRARGRRVSASTSPNTCGCLRTSFSWMSRAACSRSPAPRSSSSSARKYDLKEKIAELVEELLRIVAHERRVGDLVRLLDRVRHDRAHGLLAVPRAVAPQPARQVLQLEKGLREAGHASRWSSWSPRSTAARSRPGSRSCRCSPSSACSPTRSSSRSSSAARAAAGSTP